MRVESDPEMSLAWILVPLAPLIAIVVFVGSIFAAIFSGVFSNLNQTLNQTQTTGPPATIGVLFVGFIFLLQLVLFIVVILFAFMVYKMVKRRNTHFARQHLLYEDLLAATRELATRKGVDVAMPLNNMDRTIRESRFDETEKGAGLYAVLTFIFAIVAFYVYYFLMKDFFKHERREDMYIDDLNRALMATGITIRLPPRTNPVPDRSFALYLILTILTAGLFGIYWIYVLVTDPNNHFHQQAMIEDTLLAQITAALSGPSTMPSQPPPSPPSPPFTTPVFTPSSQPGAPPYSPSPSPPSSPPP